MTDRTAVRPRAGAAASIMLSGLPDLRRPGDQRAVAAVLVACTALLLVIAQAGGGLPGEQALIRWTRRTHAVRPLQDVCVFFGALGTPVVALITVALLARAVDRHLGRPATLLLLAAASGSIPVAILKIVIGPTTPWLEAAQSSAPNFPSGHVAYATTVFGAAAI